MLIRSYKLVDHLGSATKQLLAGHTRFKEQEKKKIDILKNVLYMQ